MGLKPIGNSQYRIFDSLVGSPALAHTLHYNLLCQPRSDVNIASGTATRAVDRSDYSLRLERRHVTPH